jgi:chromosome partitioning protein
MKILAIASQKGGVGKTTVALNLCCALAARGWKTLLLDADFQGSVADSVAGAADRSGGLLATLRNGGALEEAILPTRLERLSLLHMGRPAGEDLPAGQGEERRIVSGLPRLLSELPARYDLVVVDTASGLHSETLSMVAGADYLLVPIQAEPLALRSAPGLLGAVAALRGQGSKVAVAGFLLTMVSSRQQVTMMVAQEAWARLPPGSVLECFVPRDEQFQQASLHGVPVRYLRRPPPELEPRIELIESGQDADPISLLD